MHVTGAGDAFVVREAISMIEERISQNIERFGTEYPEYGIGQSFVMTDNDHWMTGFWPGMLWLAHGISADEQFADAARALLPSFAERLERRVDMSHDLGFLYSLSARAEWEITGNEQARQLGLDAAGALLDRFRPIGGYLQAWGDLGDEREGGRFIIDGLMNLPLLFWAGAETGRTDFVDAAVGHAETTLEHLVRDDWSTAHTFVFNQDSGDPLGPRGHQGHGDSSVWSRGQAWAIYGFAVAAQWADRPDFLEASIETGRWFIDAATENPPPWDFRLPGDAQRHPDSSAAAIAAGGLLRLSRMHSDPERAAEASSQAHTLLHGLIASSLETDVDAHGLLRHGSYSVNEGIGVDCYTTFGDYFFLESLLGSSIGCPDFWGPPSTDTEQQWSSATR